MTTIFLAGGTGKTPLTIALVNRPGELDAYGCWSGCVVDDACPDFKDAHEVFMALRGFAFESNLGAIMDQHPGVLKGSIVWSIEPGRKLTASQLIRATKMRTALFQRMHAFMQTYDFIVLPVSQVPPFPVEQEFVTEIDGVKMEN